MITLNFKNKIQCQKLLNHKTEHSSHDAQLLQST